MKFSLNSYPDYIGICCQFGKYQADSGTATVQTISNSSNLAKAAYYFGYTKGWASSVGTSGGSNAFVYECILQDLTGSFDVVINNPSGWSAITYQQAVNQKQIATNAMNSNPTWDDNPAPGGFSAYVCDAGNSYQNFIVWKNVPNGYVKVKKISANTSITG